MDTKLPTSKGKWIWDEKEEKLIPITPRPRGKWRCNPNWVGIPHHCEDHGCGTEVAKETLEPPKVYTGLYL